MKPDTYKLIQMCVEAGVTRGLRRAYKHDDAPTKEQIEKQINEAVMLEVCEWFEFDQKGEGWEP
jgi:hypothetical protein